MDANKIVEHLYQGSKPSLKDAKELAHIFDALVLAANEHQLDTDKILPTLHVRLNDYPSVPITEKEKELAVKAGKAVADMIDDGKDVMVTCVAGLNRSGLISALALMNSHHKMTPQQAMSTIRQARPMALFNKSFISFLKSLATSSREQ